MQFPLSWLREILPLEKSVEDLAKILTMLGIEVESYHPLLFNFEGVVAARILKVESHPHSPQLYIATIFDGIEHYQVVCRAPNCRVGVIVPYARLGAKIGSPENGQCLIELTEFQGVSSTGMLCSAFELDLGTQQDCLLELDLHTAEGTDLQQIYQDTIFHVGLTPNLGHCLSIYGIARELAAALHLVPPKIDFQFIEKGDKNSTKNHQVNLTSKSICSRYSCRLIHHVKVGPSPIWLQQRLKNSGIRCINNIVDVTNYIAMEMGQPMHAFDFDQIAEGKLIVRLATEGETLVTLDGIERRLNAETIVISDPVKGLAIAGVMGGASSQVRLETKRVWLESASFCSTSVRKTSKALGLISDSSKRFERGIDLHQTVTALNRAVMLIEQLAAGEAESNMIDSVSVPLNVRMIACRLSQVNRLLGTEWQSHEVQELLERLDFKVSTLNKDELAVAIPSYRNDIHLEIDLVEEVARLYGYIHLPRRKMQYTPSNLPAPPLFTLKQVATHFLVGQGLQQMMTCDLIAPQQVEMTQLLESSSKQWISLVNPTSLEQSMMRPSLLPGLLQAVQHNLAHQTHTVAGFEIGRIYYNQQGHRQEESVLNIVLTGRKNPPYWEEKYAPAWDFFDIKGFTEGLAQRLQIPTLDWQKGDISQFHPGRQAYALFDDKPVVWLGEIHPAILRRWNIGQRVLFAHLALEQLLPYQQKASPMRRLAHYPSSERDWNVLLPEEIEVGNVLKIIETLKIPYLEGVHLKDIYRGEQHLQSFKKNVTLHFVYRDPYHTLSQQTVEMQHQRIVEAVHSAFNLSV